MWPLFNCNRPKPKLQNHPVGLLHRVLQDYITPKLVCDRTNESFLVWSNFFCNNIPNHPVPHCILEDSFPIILVDARDSSLMWPPLFFIRHNQNDQTFLYCTALCKDQYRITWVMTPLFSVGHSVTQLRTDQDWGDCEEQQLVQDRGWTKLKDW